jgi:uncharacterized protein (TIGR02246 family)
MIDQLPSARGLLYLAFFLLVGSCLLVACQPSGLSDADASTGDIADADGDEAMEIAYQANIRAINDLIGQYVVAYNTEDPAAFQALYTVDAVRLPPDAKALEGLGPIRVYIEDVFAATDPEVTLHIEETEFSSDLAFVRGSWVLGLTHDNGESQSTLGKWVSLMRRQEDGSWKIARDIWNRDTPVPCS